METHHEVREPTETTQDQSLTSPEVCESSLRGVIQDFLDGKVDRETLSGILEALQCKATLIDEETHVRVLELIQEDVNDYPRTPQFVVEPTDSCDTCPCHPGEIIKLYLKGKLEAGFSDTIQHGRIQHVRNSHKFSELVAILCSLSY